MDDFGYKVIRLICTGLPGPSACVAPQCNCFEQHGIPVYEELCKLFADHKGNGEFESDEK